MLLTTCRSPRATVSSRLREERIRRTAQPFSEDFTMSLKTALLVALILALSYQHVTAALYPGIPKECCYSYRTGKPLSHTLFQSYYRTSGDCFLNAVVLVTKSGKQTCFNPAERWVRQIMRRLQEKK